MRSVQKHFALPAIRFCTIWTAKLANLFFCTGVATGAIRVATGPVRNGAARIGAARSTKRAIFPGAAGHVRIGAARSTIGVRIGFCTPCAFPFPAVAISVHSVEKILVLAP
jgi:hypothetical protein